MSTTLRFRITFTEEVLGTQPGDPEIYRKFVGSKAPDAPTMEEEVAALGADAVIENGITVFPRDENGNLMLWEHQIKGFFKDTCSALARCPEFKSSKLKAFKKIIDGCIFLDNRRIPIQNYGKITLFQRPLRGQTAQGERISLACSERIEAGATAEFSVICLNDAYAPLVREWMDYGKYRGLLQWRNSGCGRFTYEEIAA